LARLSLSDDEKKLYTEQLAKILEYFDELKKVDTESIEPMAHALSVVSVMRDDEPKECVNREQLLGNAPAEENGYFRVPRIGE
jgi:aspartyl-tRNA(Asn)/glutamyl-tRNA(Gln) amidotransferase subunit C